MSTTRRTTSEIKSAEAELVIAPGETSRPGSPLEAALDYAGRGWPVLPLHRPKLDQRLTCTCGNKECRSVGKHPRIRGGHNNASTDPDQIRSWWARWPNANVGVATGEGLLVLDVDPRNGGDRSLVELEQEHGVIHTMTVRTGSGGVHYYFTTDEEVRCRSGVLAGIDLKAEGGYVVAPPSLHPEGRYILDNDATAVPAPSWLLDLAAASSAPNRGGRSLDQLRSYWAPGDTAGQRVRWTREAVEAIPNEGEMDERESWVGMAHAIRASCGEGAQTEAFEIFDEFSDRWEGPADPSETERVWTTLNKSRSPGGYPYLLDLARKHGYECPSDHPDHPSNVFEALEPLPASEMHETEASEALIDVDQVLNQLEGARLSTMERSLQKLDELRSHLDARQEQLVRHRMEATLRRRFGRDGALQLVREVFPEGNQGVFDLSSGEPRLQWADPSRLDVETPFLVESLIPMAAVGELIGGYGTGKTWLLLHLALSVAFNRPLFGRPVSTAPAIYMAAEGQRGLWDRIAGWLHHHDLLPRDFTMRGLHDVLEGRLHVADQTPTFQERMFEGGLRNSIAEVRAGLVIIDTLTKHLGSDQSEDSSDTAGQVMRMLSQIAAGTNASFVLARHVGHTNRDRGRGSSAWTQGADFAFRIDGHRDDLARGRSMSIVPVKIRDGKYPRPMRYRLEDVHGLQRSDHAIATACIEPIDSGLDALTEPTTLAAAIFQFLQENPGSSARAIRNGVTGGSTKIDDTVWLLEVLEAVTNQGDATQKSYAVNPEWRVGSDGHIQPPAPAGPDIRLERGDEPGRARVV